MDISNTVAPKSDQINSDDFLSGPKTFKIARVSANEGTPEQPVNVYFEETKLPFRPCKSMRRVMISAWGPDASKYVGRSITLYRDPNVKFGGMNVGGIRISHMSHIDAKMVMTLTASKAKKAPFTVNPLTVTTAPAEPTPDNTAALQSARDAAKTGSDGFRSWWKDNPDKRSAAGEIMDELKKLAADADAAMVPDVDDDEVPL